MSTKSESGALRRATKSKLLQAAISEIEQHGVTELSVRRIAEQCGMSPGAPYRHFDDKNDLILEVLRSATEEWTRAQHAELRQSGVTQREQIVELCMAYIDFLCKNPEFQTILMMNDRALAPQQREEKGRISQTTMQLVLQYCASVQMDEATIQRKLFTVRAIIYGAAFMINAGVVADVQQALETTRGIIEREFDIA